MYLDLITNGKSSKMKKTKNKGQEHEGNDILQDDLAEVPEDNLQVKRVIIRHF